MRFGGNFHPDWGYLAPAPNFMRTARIVAVATAIGATAGAAVVLSLVDRPGTVAETSKTLVVVRSLVLPAEAAVPVGPKADPVAAATPAPKTDPVAAAAPTAVIPSQAEANVAPPAQPAVSASASAPAPSEAHAVATPTASASVTALAESPPATEGAMPGGDAITIDTSTAANPSGPKAAMAPAAKKLPGVPAAAGPQQAQRPVAAPPRKRTAGNEGLGPILRRLFSAN